MSCRSRIARGTGRVAIAARQRLVLGVVTAGLMAAAATVVSVQPAAATTPSGSLYVVDTTDGTVTPVNVATKTVGTAIDVGGAGIYIHNIACTPDGKAVYVAKTGGIVPINTTTNTVGSAISLPGTAFGVAITPNGAKAYVSDTNGYVYPVTLGSGAVGAGIHLGNFPEGIAITPNGKTVYVTNTDGNVYPISTATNAVGTPINITNLPYAVGVTPNGATAYATQSTTIVPIDTSTNIAGSAIDVGGVSDGVAFSPDSKTAYVSSTDGNVIPVSTATNTEGTPIPVGSAPNLQGIAMAPGGGTVYAAATNGDVYPINTTTKIAGAGIPVAKSATYLAFAPAPATLPGPPVHLKATSANTAVSLTWTAPTSTGGSAITGYDIYGGTAPGHEGSKPVNSSPLPPTSRKYVFKGLKNGVRYYFKVRALNAVGLGTASNEASAAPATVPSAPQHLKAATANSAVTLTWTAPISTGGSSITGYDVYEGTAPGHEGAKAINSSPLAPTSRKYSVKRLKNGVRYYFKARALNTVGRGVASNEASAKPAKAGAKRLDARVK